MARLFGKLTLSVLLGLSLSACFTTKNPEAANQSVNLGKVDRAATAFYVEEGLEDEFPEAWSDLTPAEMELWIEEMYKINLEAHRELEANPYIEREVLSDSGLTPVEMAKELGTRNPDDVAERMDAEGMRTETYRLTPEELKIEKEAIEEHYIFMKTFNNLAVELFGKSMNQINNEEWDAVDAEYARLE